MRTSSVAAVLSGAAPWCAVHTDCRAGLASLPDASIDAIISDPIYPEIDRHYGRISEAEWHVLMREVVALARRVLKPTGSAVFILQDNSEHIGRLRAWLPRFEVWIREEWNCPQDAYWWNHAAMPTQHAQRVHGLMRPSVKRIVWAGAANCYRDQDAVLWSIAERSRADVAAQRATRSPSGHCGRPGRAVRTALERGGVTPFNLLPAANTASSGRGAAGHGASTPYEIAAWWTRYLCPPGGVVCDPFGGAFTMAKAAVDQGRRAIMFERDVACFEMGMRRMGAAGSPLSAA